MAITRLGGANAITGTIPVANGGTGVTTSAALANTGNLVLLHTIDASNNSTISFDGYFDSAYTNYKIFISDLTPSGDGAFLRIRVRQSNADRSDDEYFSVVGRGLVTSSSDGVSIARSRWGTSYADLSQDMNSSNPTQVDFTLFNPLGTTFKKYGIWDIASQDTNNNEFYRTYGSFKYSHNTNALSGITFFYNGGNVATGKFQLYGIKS